MINSKLNLYYQKLIKYPLFALVILLPFNGLISTFTRFELGISNFWIYKDLLLAFIIICTVKYWAKYIHSKIAIVIILYLTLCIASIFWAPDSSLLRLVSGIKYSSLFLISFVGGIVAYEHKIHDQLIKIMAWSGIMAVLISLALHFGYGPTQFTNFGFRDDWSTHYAGEAPAFCQKIENQNICRLQGVFSGPNQLGAYLIILTGLCLMCIKNSKIVRAILFSIGIVAVLTFSRSGILGLILFYIIYLTPKLSKKMLMGVIVSFCLAGVLLVSLKPELFIRPESSFGHLSSFKNGIDFSLKSPLFGNGLATAGSASNFFENPVIPENWFLGIAGQLGIVGMALFIAIYYLICKNNFDQKQKELFAISLGLLVPLMLLHSFEDSTVAYSFFLLQGMYFFNNSGRST